MPVHTYTNWNVRSSDMEEQVEPYRKYFFICEGANTETFYFKRLIDLRKQLGINPLIDIRLWEKTDGDKNLSFPKNLVKFAGNQKKLESDFDYERDKMVIVFDGDIFEEKVQGYDDLIAEIEGSGDIAAVTNPGFELFLILHVENSIEQYIQGNEKNFVHTDEKGSYSYAYNLLREITGMNAKKNPEIGKMADNVLVAIEQEKRINQDIHDIKGKVTSNVGSVIEMIIKEKPDI